MGDVNRRLPVFDRRRAGVLLHPTALPGERGAFGASGRAFIDWLASAGFSVWQVLPLGPVTESRSPYWTRSDFALDAQFIDCMETADPRQQRGEFKAFRERNEDWLEDYALFVALGEDCGGAAWWDWPAALRERERASLESARQRLAPRLEQLRTEQWNAARQLAALREYAQQRAVRLFGDLPFYVAPDSATAWAHREQLQLTATGKPALLAGVPPDYFSADGQLWGYPLYDWTQAQRDHFAFWRMRLRVQLARFDVLRIDHFRGLVDYWAVPPDAANARSGAWHAAPGRALLETLRRDWPDFPLVAEDLGDITEAVEALRREFGLPGMRVLQFAFDGSPGNPHLPHHIDSDTLAYTGTHDNDTTLGWYRALDDATRQRVDILLRVDVVPMPEALSRAALASPASLAVLPIQDLLGLGSEARFNTPGTMTGNWRWRLWHGALDNALAGWSRALNRAYDRDPCVSA
jgi:4-alpha-glucanotransferase